MQNSLPIQKHNCAQSRTGLACEEMVSQENTNVVALVDDDESIRSALQGLMKVAGYRTMAFASAEDFLNSGEQQRIGCLIADIRLPGMSGLDLQLQLNTHHHKIPIIFITAHGDERMRMQALRAGAVDFLAKPFDDTALLEQVRAAFDE
jgi:FixJ family two-component response regulator